jgi:hypothetical protein
MLKTMSTNDPKVVRALDAVSMKLSSILYSKEEADKCLQQAEEELRQMEAELGWRQAEVNAMWREIERATSMQIRVQQTPPSVASFLAEVANRLTTELREAFATFFAGAAPVRAASAREPIVHVRIPDKQIELQVFRRHDGAYNLMVETQDLSLSERRFRIRFAAVAPTSVTLKRADDKTVFGKVVIPREIEPSDWAALTIELHDE